MQTELKGKTQYLVKWLGSAPEESEWMCESDLLHCQDAVERYLDCSLAASQAAQKRKDVWLDQQTKSDSQRALSRRIAVEQAKLTNDPSSPMDVDVSNTTRSSHKRRKPHFSMLLCLLAVDFVGDFLPTSE